MRKKILIINFSILILFLLDRIIKIWFIKNPNVSWDFINNLLSFGLEKNTGIAFGLPLNFYLITTLSVIIIFLVLAYIIKWYQDKNWFLALNFSLVAVVAISNLIDRIKFGYVVDYLDVPFFTVFNLADVMISLGVGLIILESVFIKKAR